MQLKIGDILRAKLCISESSCLSFRNDFFTHFFNRVHFAGTETARRWMGYIDGAVESGIRAAKEVTARMQSPDKPISSNVASPSPIFEKKSHKQEDCVLI